MKKITCKVYGYPLALHVDPIKKKPLYHFLPHTDYKMLDSHRIPLYSLKKAYNIAKKQGIKNVYLGNV